ncbi:MAG: hypothetical protein KA743_00405 [Geothrix sp.]|nr:hypothetical protein [Geothrix sp.]
MGAVGAHTDVAGVPKREHFVMKDELVNEKEIATSVLLRWGEAHEADLGMKDVMPGEPLGTEVFEHLTGQVGLACPAQQGRDTEWKIPLSLPGLQVVPQRTGGYRIRIRTDIGRRPGSAVFVKVSPQRSPGGDVDPGFGHGVGAIGPVFQEVVPEADSECPHVGGLDFHLSQRRLLQAMVGFAVF